MNTRRIAVLFAGLVAGATTLAATPTRTAHYDLDLALDPRQGSLQARVEMRDLPCAGSLTFALNRAVRIARVQVDGRTVEPRLVEENTRRATRTLSVPCPARTLALEYTGAGPLTEDGRNQISPTLVELSLYGAWYPRLAGKFTYRATVALDETFTLVSNGRSVREGASRGVARHTLTSLQPVGDIALVASPNFVRLSANGEGRIAALTRNSLPAGAQTAAREATAAASRAAALYTTWFGGTDSAGTPVAAHLAFSLRSGPLSYARLPLIVFPESELTEPDDATRGYPYLGWAVGHEMGHFWWSWAEYSPREDWLNEGLAEYAAARFVRETYGDKAYAALLAQYRRAATKAGTEATAIVETPSDSAWTYANRYAKPALLLDALERALGSDRIGRFLKAVHDSALARNALTTDTAQTIARDTLGDEPARLFARCLAVRGWPTECGG